MANILPFIVFCVTLFDFVVGEYCFRETGFVSFQTLECPFGCCGTHSTRYCCVTDIGMIVGIVIGSLIGLAVIIGIGVTICLCVKKKNTTKGRVIYPAVVGGNTVVGYSNQTSSSNAVYPPNPYGTAYGGYAPATYSNPYGSYPPPTYGNAFGGEAPYPPLNNQPPYGTQTDNGVVDPYSIHSK